MRKGTVAGLQRQLDDLRKLVVPGVCLCNELGFPADDGTGCLNRAPAPCPVHPDVPRRVIVFAWEAGLEALAAQDPRTPPVSPNQNSITAPISPISPDPGTALEPIGAAQAEEVPQPQPEAPQAPVMGTDHDHDGRGWHQVPGIGGGGRETDDPTHPAPYGEGSAYSPLSACPALG